MKKWATNKSHSSSSSISRIFPVSWFFKSKKKGGNSEKQFEFAAPKSSSALNLKQGRFYSMDEDDYFWRLSFGDERIQGRKSTGGINDHEFKGFKSTAEIRKSEECRNFNEMVSDIKRMREESRGKQRKTGERKGGGDSTRKQRDLNGKTSRKSWGFDDEGEKISTFRDLNDQTSRKSRGFDDEEEKVSTLQERFSNSARKRGDLIDQTSRKSWGFDGEQEKISKFPDLNDQTSRKLMGFDDEDEKASTLHERFSNSVSEWLEIEGRKLKEIKIKSDSRKNSAKINRGIIKSPRTECKIRALEKMKKSRSKTKKKEEQVLEENTIFDSFAVVKSSYNPQKDFRESMMEMIRERGIESAQDLEELLACYLTLNCDEYHDLIIKVFRQIWFQCVDPSVKNGSYFDHGID